MSIADFSRQTSAAQDKPATRPYLDCVIVHVPPRCRKEQKTSIGEVKSLADAIERASADPKLGRLVRCYVQHCTLETKGTPDVGYSSMVCWSHGDKCETHDFGVK